MGIAGFHGSRLFLYSGCNGHSATLMSILPIRARENRKYACIPWGRRLLVGRVWLVVHVVAQGATWY